MSHQTHFELRNTAAAPQRGALANGVDFHRRPAGAGLGGRGEVARKDGL